MRHRIRRAFRKSCNFSKKVENHVIAFELAFFYINLVSCDLSYFSTHLLSIYLQHSSFMNKNLRWGIVLTGLLGLAWSVSTLFTFSDKQTQQSVSISVSKADFTERTSIVDQVSRPQTPKDIAEQRWEQKREKRLNGWSKSKYDGPDIHAQTQERIRTRETERAPGYSHNYPVKELRKAKEKLATMRTEAVEWDSRGPSNVPGRSRAVLPLPSNPQNNWLLGSAAGGIWKTTDAGDSWTNQTDDFPNLATTTLAMSQGVIYAGTGELVGGSIGVNGMGIFKSTDEGETWKPLGSTMDELRFTNVNRIIVNPDDSNHLIVSTSAYNRNRVRFFIDCY